MRVTALLAILVGVTLLTGAGVAVASDDQIETIDYTWTSGFDDDPTGSDMTGHTGELTVNDTGQIYTLLTEAAGKTGANTRVVNNQTCNQSVQVISTDTGVATASFSGNLTTVTAEGEGQTSILITCHTDTEQYGIAAPLTVESDTTDEDAYFRDLEVTPVVIILTLLTIAVGVSVKSREPILYAMTAIYTMLTIGWLAGAVDTVAVLGTFGLLVVAFTAWKAVTGEVL